MHPFEKILSVSSEDIEFELKNYPLLEWSTFLLNPRRLRGSDFLMRWSQGVWSEKRVIQAINQHGEFWAIPYGPSGVAPTGDVRAFELYFERLEAAGLGETKRPDLLIFAREAEIIIVPIIEALGGLSELPFIPEDNPQLQTILSHALIAVECENSLWRGSQMPHYNAPLRPQKRLNNKMGLPKNAVLPTIILKEEDRQPLQTWQNSTSVPIHIWHLFFDIAFGISLNRIQQLLQDGFIEPTEQTFQAPGGAVTKKQLYKIYHHYAYSLGHTVEEPTLEAKAITDRNGHILPYVHFEGGRMNLSDDTLNILREIKNAKN